MWLADDDDEEEQKFLMTKMHLLLLMNPFASECMATIEGGLYDLICSHPSLTWILNYWQLGDTYCGDIQEM